MKEKIFPIRACTDADGLEVSRRSFMKAATLLAGGAALAAMHARPAAAQQKASKAAMQYRTTPNGKQECSNCLQFIPGKSATADGTCKVVEGAISPHGYCIAYAPKA